MTISVSRSLNIVHNIFLITLFAQLYSRVGSLLACDHFISRRGEGWT